MKKFKVYVEEVLRRLVEVEAATQGEAEVKVQQMYDNSEIVLDAGDHVSTEIYDSEEEPDDSEEEDDA